MMDAVKAVAVKRLKDLETYCMGMKTF